MPEIIAFLRSKNKLNHLLTTCFFVSLGQEAEKMIISVSHKLSSDI